MLPPPRSTLVVGAGRAGTRRARVAARHPRSRLAGVCDLDPARAAALCDELGGEAFADWRLALARLHPELVVASTPNRWLCEIAVAALAQGAHVLVEKPFGRSGAEACAMAAAASAAGRVVKAGFNHRFHPAIARALELLRGGAIGRPRLVRGVYGHGGRPGYQQEWRADPELAGGGELLDQGVHLLDLTLAAIGRPARVFAELGTLCWSVPVEDNALVTLRGKDGALATLHASWTQWQNRFEWQVYGEDGALEVSGLSGSYGPPSLTVLRRRPDQPPAREVQAFAAEDRSWECEWDDFLHGLDHGEARSGAAAQGCLVMEVVDALYRAARTGRALDLP